MEESESSRFRKLPVGLWINSPRKHFAKLGARWPSASSVKSITSSDAHSIHEIPSAPSAPSTTLCISTPSLAPPSPCPSPAFLRPRPAQPQSRAKRLSHLFLRGRSNSDRDRAIGDREREVWAHSATPSSHHYLPPASSSAPGLIKLYGDALSSGANYRSLLANIHSTAKQLISQVITRYTEREKEGEGEDGALHKHSPADFLLCDVIGRPIQQPDGAVEWHTECRRTVASWECPLLLIDMWRPKDGFERRFEIRKREDYEREEREKEQDRDGDSYAGVRWRRSRMASGGVPEDSERGHRGRNTELRRSISDMNLSLKRRQGNHASNDSRHMGNVPGNGGGIQDRKNIVSMIATDSVEAPGSKVGAEGNTQLQKAEEQKNAASCDLEVMSQSLILPPTDCPYFLLLQGYDQSKDFVLYIMSGHMHVFGRKPTFREREKDRERERKGTKPLKVDTFLTAPDLLSRHLLVRRDSALPGQPAKKALVRPFRGGAVTHNGAALYREAELKSGDLLGLGSHFLFLYRDPRIVPAPPLALPLPWQPDSSSFSSGSLADKQEGLQQYLGSTEALLRFHPKHADALLQEIISKNSLPDSGSGTLAPAYLLSVMIDYASKHLDPALMPQLLLKAASQIKGIVWDKVKEFGDQHDSQNSTEQEADASVENIEKVSSDLRPLIFWMSNATELLNFFQVKVEAMEKEWEFEDPGDPVLSADLDSCSEALSQLDDVIMHTFQHCVYHLTKTLYSFLPTLLDTNPFSSEEKDKDKEGLGEQGEGEGSGEAPEDDVSALPPTVAGLVEVYRRSLLLTREACLSPPLTSQTFGYLFFFTNTSLLNTLLERDSLFSWSRAVQIRTNLDLVLDWLQGVGLGDVASEFLKKLSMTVNFLCIPKTRLIQVPAFYPFLPQMKSSWSSLQEDHPLLSSAQLHHMLMHYKLGPARAPPALWTPPPGTELGGDIFESFLDHPPLILPNETPQLDVTRPIPSPELQQEITRLRSFLWGLDQDELPANQRTRL